MFKSRIESNCIVLVVAAHPDDEVLGCGGTIAKHVSSGDAVHIVFMTNGVESRVSESQGSLDADKRRKAAKQSCALLETSVPVFFDFPDNKMDTVALLDVVQKIETVIKSINPDIIYTHHAGDLNIDHRVTHQAVMTSCRPQPNFPVREIYSFEVASSTEWVSQSMGSPFLPACYVDISETWSTKQKALLAYQDELREFPHSRSIEAIQALAINRGSSMGLEYAEAFQVERLLH